MLQVCIPGLHLSLGIFNRLYNLLEEACHELDLLLAEHISGEQGSGTSHDQYSSALHQLSELKERLGVERQAADLAEQVNTYLVLTLPDTQESQQMQALRQEASARRRRVTATVRTCEFYTLG